MNAYVTNHTSLTTISATGDNDEPVCSPDGKKIAYLAPVNNILNVWVKTIGADDDRVVTKDEKRDIRTYFWAYDNQHIF